MKRQIVPEAEFIAHLPVPGAAKVTRGYLMKYQNLDSVRIAVGVPAVERGCFCSHGYRFDAVGGVVI